MKVTEILAQKKSPFASFELVPPLKGSDISKLYNSIEPLMEFAPPFINITFHRDEVEYRQKADGTIEKVTVTKRPGSVAIAAAIMKRFPVEVVPHIICGGASKHKIENDLLDLNFLDIQNVVALRGDAIPGQKHFSPEPEGHRYSCELVEQIHKLNQGIYLDENITNAISTNFCIGVAGYPEKHYEAPNIDIDIENLKQKVEAGADYIITQMFFDNEKFYQFTEQCRAAGITVPIIPGLKPISTQTHIEMLPRAFSLDLPQELMQELRKCKDNKDIYQVGIEWCAAQSKDLLAHGAPAIHYYTMGKADNIREILNQNIESAEAQYAQYTGANKAFSESEKVKYEEMIAAAKEAYQNTSMDDGALTGVITSLLARMDTLANNVAAYETLAQKIEALNKAYDETPYANDGLEDYEVYLDEVLQAGYDNGTFDVTELDSIQPRADRIFRESVVKALADGTTDNVTGLMVNPNFAGSNDGWTKTGDGDFKNDGTRVSEVWNGQNWEVYQEISNLPQGSYKITMQGFYSPSSGNENNWHEGWGQEGDETNNILGYLFGNDASEPLLHVTACPQEENVAENCEEVTWTDDASLAGKWLCHGKNSAQEIFEQNSENYLNATTCYVGEDGKLRIGVKMSGVSWGQAWVIFDNFQVEYLGADNMEGAQTALDALVREANGMLASEVLTTQEAKDGLNKAIEAASAVGELTPEVYKEQTEALNAAIKFGQESMDAATALEDKVTAHDKKLSGTGEASYEEYSNTEGYDELYDLTIEIFDKIDGEGIFTTLDEINDYSVRLDKTYSKMLSGHIDFTTANKDEPVDATGLIVNPSFQTKTENDKGEIVDAASADGWLVESLKGGSGVKDAKVYEIFSDSSEVYQPLYNAPAGYYRVVMNGFYRAGGFIDAGVARRDSADAQNAELFVKCGDGNWIEKLPSIFEHVSELKYDGSDVALPDSLFPKSNELYHFIVDQPAGAALAFEDGEYECDTYFYVGEGEEPVLGVRKTGMLTNDWSCFDNFRLYYYGDGDANRPDGFVDGIDGVSADGAVTVVSSVWYTINGVRVDGSKQRGIYIRQDLMSDGTKKAVKVLVK